MSEIPAEWFEATFNGALSGTGVDGPVTLWGVDGPVTLCLGLEEDGPAAGISSALGDGLGSSWYKIANN